MDSRTHFINLSLGSQIILRVGSLLVPLQAGKKMKSFHFWPVLDEGCYAGNARKERAMKKLLPFSSFFFWAMILLFFYAPLLAEDSRARTPETLREKAKAELEAVKQDSQKIGRDARQSAAELPSQAGKEFEKTGRALKKTGKELKESTTEAVQSFKELLKK
jgi:hypothetical protein